MGLAAAPREREGVSDTLPALLTRVVPGFLGGKPHTSDCRCGHVEFAHQHYRRGSDCALCSCQRFHR